MTTVSRLSYNYPLNQNCSTYQDCELEPAVDSIHRWRGNGSKHKKGVLLEESCAICAIYLILTELYAFPWLIPHLIILILFQLIKFLGGFVFPTLVDSGFMAKYCAIEMTGAPVVFTRQSPDVVGRKFPVIAKIPQHPCQSLASPRVCI